MVRDYRLRVAIFLERVVWLVKGQRKTSVMRLVDDGLIRVNEEKTGTIIVGSELIGQCFNENSVFVKRYFPHFASSQLPLIFQELSGS